MIKMVIADDEKIIIEGLQTLVEWSDYGITIEGCYRDGKTALDGIIKTQADIALLDINMPEMSGVEILKELNSLGVHTKIIFISGFQEFEYAKAALKYGAVAYILKPIIRAELIDGLQKCIEALNMQDYIRKEDTTPIQEDYLKKLVEPEKTQYTPAVLHIISSGKTQQEMKLIQFSSYSFIEKKLEDDERGIIFRRNEQDIIVFKGIDESVLPEYLKELCEETYQKTRHHIGLIIGRSIDAMGEIPIVYRECRKKEGYFFFYSEWGRPYIYEYENVFHHDSTLQELDESRQKLFDLMMKRDRDKYEKQFDWYRHSITINANGSRENARFHFCSGVMALQSFFSNLGIKEEFDMNKLLDKSRDAEYIDQMALVYKIYFDRYYDLIAETVDKNDNKQILEAKRYMEEHYQENLSLEVMAKQLHMNSYYFSSFFKKNTGMNYKDYLTEIRLKHALARMLSTDHSLGEIAGEVGFADMRSFTKAFHKKYGDTPGNYKKNMRKEMENHQG